MTQSVIAAVICDVNVCKRRRVFLVWRDGNCKRQRCGARNSRCRDSGGTDPSWAKIMNARFEIESTYSSSSSSRSLRDDGIYYISYIHIYIYIYIISSS